MPDPGASGSRPRRLRQRSITGQGSPPGQSAAGMVEGMDAAETQEFIACAAAALRPHQVGDRLFGNVAAVLTTVSGDRFSGVCIDTGSGTGFCAEAGAIAVMVTAGQYHIRAIVAVWRDE